MALFKRESSGNGWHTTYEISGVCYTATPQTTKTGVFAVRLQYVATREWSNLR